MSNFRDTNDQNRNKGQWRKDSVRENKLPPLHNSVTESYEKRGYNAKQMSMLTGEEKPSKNSTTKK